MEYITLGNFMRLWNRYEVYNTNVDERWKDVGEINYLEILIGDEG